MPLSPDSLVSGGPCDQPLNYIVVVLAAGHRSLDGTMGQQKGLIRTRYAVHLFVSSISVFQARRDAPVGLASFRRGAVSGGDPMAAHGFFQGVFSH